MILNVVHPYTYKLKGTTLDIGPSEETKERDSKVSHFVQAVLGSGGRVVAHERFDERGVIAQDFHRIAVEMDPFLKILYEPRVEWVSTTRFGLPIEDKRPERVSKGNWRKIQKCLITRSRFAKILGESEKLVFIGGALENCVAEIALYSLINYRKEIGSVFVIPELCATFDPKQRAYVEGVLAEKGVGFLSVEQAFGMVKEK